MRNPARKTYWDGEKTKKKRKTGVMLHLRVKVPQRRIQTLSIHICIFPILIIKMCLLLKKVILDVWLY